jgi:hypothetical protein
MDGISYRCTVGIMWSCASAVVCLFVSAPTLKVLKHLSALFFVSCLVTLPLLVVDKTDVVVGLCLHYLLFADSNELVSFCRMSTVVFFICCRSCLVLLWQLGSLEQTAGQRPTADHGGLCGKPSPRWAVPLMAQQLGIPGARCLCERRDVLEG